MRKIPTMFERDETKKGHPVKDVLKPECAWITGSDVLVTKKIDGQNVKISAGKLFKRQKPANEDYSEASYVECSRDDPADKYLWEAYDNLVAEIGQVNMDRRADRIYECIGPKVQGNPEREKLHRLVSVVPVELCLVLSDVPRDFAGLRDYLSKHDMEGIVFHGTDGKMCKVKKKGYADFRVE